MFERNEFGGKRSGGPENDPMTCRIFCQRCARTVGTQLGVPLKSDRQPWTSHECSVNLAWAKQIVFCTFTEWAKLMREIQPVVLSFLQLPYHVASSSLAVFLFFVHLFVSLLCFISFCPFLLPFFLSSFLSSFLSFFLSSVSISLLPPSLSLSPPRRSLNCNSPQLQGVSGEDVECQLSLWIPLPLSLTLSLFVAFFLRQCHALEGYSEISFAITYNR